MNLCLFDVHCDRLLHFVFRLCFFSFVCCLPLLAGLCRMLRRIGARHNRAGGRCLQPARQRKHSATTALSPYPPAPQVRSHPVLLGECLGGALYIQDFVRLCRAAGFMDPRQLSCEAIEVGWGGEVVGGWSRRNMACFVLGGCGRVGFVDPC